MIFDLLHILRILTKELKRGWFGSKKRAIVNIGRHYRMKCQLFGSELQYLPIINKLQVDHEKNSSYLVQITPMLEDLSSIEEENRRLEESLANA